MGDIAPSMLQLKVSQGSPFVAAPQRPWGKTSGTSAMGQNIAFPPYVAAPHQATWKMSAPGSPKASRPRKTLPESRFPKVPPYVAAPHRAMGKMQDSARLFLIVLPDQRYLLPEHFPLMWLRHKGHGGTHLEPLPWGKTLRKMCLRIGSHSWKGSDTDPRAEGWPTLFFSPGRALLPGPLTVGTPQPGQRRWSTASEGWRGGGGPDLCGHATLATSTDGSGNSGHLCGHATSHMAGPMWRSHKGTNTIIWNHA